MPKLILKGVKEKICYGLNSKEFECKCNYSDCRATIISYRLITALEKFRKLVNTALRYNSGFRCTMHNFSVGGAALSRHLVGEAIDIRLKELEHLSHDDIEHALRSCGFTFIKFYKSFVHADVRQI